MEIPGTHQGTRSLSMDLEIQVPDRTAVEQVRAALQEQGFGVLTRIDVQATMKEKLDGRYEMFGSHLYRSCMQRRYSEAPRR